MGKQWKQWLTLFFGAPKSLQMVIVAMKLKDAETKAKINKWDLMKLKSFLHNKGNCKQGEKTTLRMGENNSK